jgi:hypothetical protein
MSAKNILSFSESCNDYKIIEEGKFFEEASKLKKNYEKKNKLWLCDLKLSYLYEEEDTSDWGFRTEVHQYACIKNLYKIIRESLNIMPNLKKMYFDVRGGGFHIRGIKEDIKKNFDSEMKLKNISTIEDNRNYVQGFEVTYTANKVKKFLILYFAHEDKYEKTKVSASIKYLIKEKIDNGKFEKALRDLYSYSNYND